ncbi:hypothetical protein [Pseudomonas costantinii]|uniref:hypothetical protein n=1 Tax=Pseudomonas costantinii TaxID=168469 RepID=UPI0015A1E5D9|nr:hypothetical protein [Pseudomonas costantinii]NVZ69440.1 hypothetical protein [Pseudomonas costantinii]
MRKMVFVMLLVVIAPVCFSKSNNEKDGENSVQNSRLISNGFDLSDLTFKESIQSIYKVAGVDATLSEEKTLFGYERVESFSSELLNYDNLILSGEFEGMKNKVIFHFSEKGEILALYELRVYSQPQNSHFFRTIQRKVGPPLVTRLSTDDESGISFKQAVWVKGDIIYFLLQELGNAGVKASNLAVFENNNKDFYKLLGQKGYAIDPSSLIEEALRQR